MHYASLKSCVRDLEKHKHLIRVQEEVDPNLEMAAIHRRVFQVGGPAIFFERVKGSPFPAVSNLFGTLERARFLFRGTLARVEALVKIKADPSILFSKPGILFPAGLAALHTFPKKVSHGPVLANQTSIDQLPQLKCWKDDGGAFILLPQVYSEDPEHPDVMHSNLGMYRIQLSGNEYEPNREIGMHYQLRRDIGIHHSKAILRNEPLKVSIFVGGPPAHTFAAVMYLPENLSELRFAGALAGRNFRYARQNDFVVSTDADFCITGTVYPHQTKPEGPFGDHLGYYSLKHNFPVLRVESVYHRKGAVWPFTVVGRPPQEDSIFGKLVQEIAGPILPEEIPGIKEVHAVDASGVHPLLLAIGNERYAPYEKREPREILKGANALLGYGPCALAKYLIIAAEGDNPRLSTHDIPAFLKHVLERIDFRRDLHFQTRTTIDTLDYTGGSLNQGSKLVMACAGAKIRELSASLPDGFKLPDGFDHPKYVMPGILAIRAPSFIDYPTEQARVGMLTKYLELNRQSLTDPLLVLVDDSDFTVSRFENFLWVVFTRSNPSHDAYGVRDFQAFKHWGCEGPLVIDARAKPHHAPELKEDPDVMKRVEALAARGASLHRIL